MRLHRLDLARYGKFTDYSIEFGPSKDGACDFHIIYGLNEAGKSTTFSAYLDLLYGIPERSGHNFLHPYNTMKIAARLEFDGSAHEVARLKQRSASLIDPRGQPLNEALLSGALGGIGREAYRTMFSLDDQSLKDGGNAIIQSKGELGELLFSASSGLAGLHKSLVLAGEDANSIFKKRSPNTRIAELRRTLDSLHTERQSIDTLASVYAQLTATYGQAEGAYRSASGELADARTAHQALTRILGTLPQSGELARLCEQMADFDGLARPPAEWFSVIGELMREETRLQALTETADLAISQAREAINAIAVDDGALSLGPHLDMVDNGRARFRAADNDLPKRRLALAEQDGALLRLLAELEKAGHPQPELLLLPASQIAIIRALIEARSGIEAERRAAERELERAREGLERLRAEAPEGSGRTEISDAQLSSIEQALSRVSGSDLSARLAAEERARLPLVQALQNRTGTLKPWTGELADLSPVSGAETNQINAWRAQATSLKDSIGDVETKLGELITNQRSNKARLSILSETLAANGAIDDGEARKVRERRDDAWRSHLNGLSAETAERFAEQMLRDDTVSQGRLSNANVLADLRHVSEAAAGHTALIGRHQELRTEARQAYEVLGATIASSLPETHRRGGDGLDQLARLQDWHANKDAALLAWGALQTADRSISDLRAALTAKIDDLKHALGSAGLNDIGDLSDRDLLRMADALVLQAKADIAAAATYKKALADLNRDVDERARAERQAVADDDRWQDAWRDALSVTWFADKTHSLPAVRAILTSLSGLPEILKERQDLSQRIAAMEQDQEQFRADMAALAASAGLPILQTNILAAANALVEQHAAALRASELRSARQVDLEKQLERRKGLAEELAVHAAAKDELTVFFEAGTLADVSNLLAKARERDQTEARIAALRSEIAEKLRVVRFEEAQSQLQALDVQTAERDASALEAWIDDLTERSKLLYAEMTRARDRLDAVGGDDAVARIDARKRTLHLEIEELAVRFLTLRAGTLAGEQALHAYRDRHRSSMMRRASQAFSAITGGHYTGLATQPDKDKEILIGVLREGGSRLAEEMSTGTQFQLYLALRLAGYEEFAAVRPSVPFIADDIMESFDNPRSKEVFQLLAEMAKVGQVIYLTHHWHLCEIAKATVPGVTIHELP